MAQMMGKSNAASSFGLEDYEMPTTGLIAKAKQVAINKSKSPGPIEAEAKYRKNFPGAG